MEWISVKDRLPESGIEVKTKTRDGETHYLSRGRLCDDCWYSFGYRTTLKPIYWMPLAKPPKQTSPKP